MPALANTVISQLPANTMWEDKNLLGNRNLVEIGPLFAIALGMVAMPMLTVMGNYRHNMGTDAAIIHAIGAYHWRSGCINTA
ncbi:hypothetical protein EJB05_07403, partial [Eragrostis curvula]